MRIHARLALLSFAVSLVALGAVTLLWNAELHRERRRELDDRVLDQARVLAALLPSDGDSVLADPARLRAECDRLVRLLHRETGMRLTVIDAEGVVLAESDVAAADVEGMENHRERPEILAALERGVGRSSRPSPTLKTPMAYVAVRWGPAARPLGTARAALPMTRVIAEQNRGLGRLITVVLGALGFSALLGYVAARRITRPVAQVSAETRLIAEGALDRRVEPRGTAEVHELALAVNHLADSLRHEILAVEVERLRLERLLQGMPDGILALDAGGRITLANAAARNLLGTGDDVVGKTPVEAVRSAELQQAVDRVLTEDRAETVELRVLEPERRTLSVTLVPLESGIVIVLHDVTRLRRLESARREMVANIGHELRTPLSAILGYLETLEHAEDLSPEDRARFLAVISRNGRRLERLVRDLSRLSELESAQAKLTLEPLAVDALLAQVVETLGPRAEDRGVHLEKEPATSLPDVLADRHGLETVLLNLLDNAVRVSPPGSIVRVRALRRNGFVRFEVLDHGPGVPRDLRERVFERFYRIDTGRSSEEGGSGLGLAIVKHTILLHGGDVGVEDAPEGGALFHFTLPATLSGV
jgi:two-component system phosphate regulon sensor histidine kinase PhoR